MPRPNELGEPWVSLAVKFGSVKKMADEFGVHTGTIRRWDKKITKMSGPTKRLLEYFLIDFGIDNPNASSHEVHNPQESFQEIHR